ncbi:MAG: hypothetical protein ACRDGW_11195, partial [Actinomycetota bacterium]
MLTPELLGRTLAAAPDPELARVALARAGEDPGARAMLAREDVLAVAVRLLGFSTAATDFLVAHPEETRALMDVRRRTRARLDRELAEDAERLGAADALRRFRRRAMLRIAARDLGGAPLEEIVEEISEVAEACISSACSSVGAGELAVIGLGKLGGRELNYSSDVDVIFVHAEGGVRSHERADPAVASLIRLLSE